LKDAKVVVQGFGNAGSFAAHLLDEAQSNVIAVSDSRTCIQSKDGPHIPKLMLHKEWTGSVAGFSGADELTADKLLELECDILAPAA